MPGAAEQGGASGRVRAGARKGRPAPERIAAMSFIGRPGGVVPRDLALR